MNVEREELRAEIKAVLIEFSAEIIATWFKSAVEGKIDKTVDKIMGILYTPHIKYPLMPLEHIETDKIIPHKYPIVPLEVT